jgi:hypothetical protein
VTEVSKPWGYPFIAGWFISKGKSPISKWMITRGTPISGNYHKKNILERSWKDNKPGVKP